MLKRRCTGWNFGALYGLNRKRNAGYRSNLVSHNLDKVMVFDFFFGNGSRLLSVPGDSSTGKSGRVVKFDNFEEVYNFTAPVASTVYVNNSIVRLLDAGIDAYYTPDYLNEIRCDLAPQLSAVLKSKNTVRVTEAITVAAHVRTGDLIWSKEGLVGEMAPSSDSRKHSKLQSLDGYFSTFDSIQSILRSIGYKKVDLLAFTSSVSPNNQFDKNMTTEFRKRGIRLTIDSEAGAINEVTGRAIDTLSQLITADILILASSTFSHIAGFYNPNCVLYEKYDRPIPVFWQHYMLPGWIELMNATYVAQNREILNEKIPHCLRSKFTADCSSHCQ